MLHLQQQWKKRSNAASWVHINETATREGSKKDAQKRQRRKKLVGLLAEQNENNSV